MKYPINVNEHIEFCKIRYREEYGEEAPENIWLILEAAMNLANKAYADGYKAGQEERR